MLSTGAGSTVGITIQGFSLCLPSPALCVCPLAPPGRLPLSPDSCVTRKRRGRYVGAARMGAGSRRRGWVGEGLKAAASGAAVCWAAPEPPSQRRLSESWCSTRCHTAQLSLSTNEASVLASRQMALVGKPCPTLSEFYRQIRRAPQRLSRASSKPCYRRRRPLPPPLTPRCTMCCPAAAGLTFVKGDPVAIPSRTGPMVVEIWATWWVLRVGGGQTVVVARGTAAVAPLAPRAAAAVVRRSAPGSVIEAP